jgi:alpha-tubulin suppressor-like RCC1 family protein
MIKKIIAVDDSSFLIHENGDLVGWGLKNARLGSYLPFDRWLRPNPISLKNLSAVSDIWTNGHFHLFVKNNIELWWLRGHLEEDLALDVKLLYTFESPIKTLSMPYLLTENGSVYNISIRFDELASTLIETHIDQVLNLPSVVQIADSFALDKEGRVWTWLDLNTFGKYTEPTLVDQGNYTQIAAGQACLFALDRDGNIFGLGINPLDFGEDWSRESFSKIPSLCHERFLQIEAGANGVFGIHPDGGVWFWGQLLSSSEVNPEWELNYYEAGPLPNLKNISKMSASSHTLFLDHDGYVYALGQNKYGQLGTGDQIDTYYPVRIG